MVRRATSGWVPWKTAAWPAGLASPKEPCDHTRFAASSFRDSYELRTSKTERKTRERGESLVKEHLLSVGEGDKLCEN